ncbi:hypothetical protein B0T19DRAFT_460026, partial [Cercophora scortea]
REKRKDHPDLNTSHLPPNQTVNSCPKHLIISLSTKQPTSAVTSDNMATSAQTSQGLLKALSIILLITTITFLTPAPTIFAKAESLAFSLLNLDHLQSTAFRVFPLPEIHAPNTPAYRVESIHLIIALFQAHFLYYFSNQSMAGYLVHRVVGYPGWPPVVLVVNFARVWLATAAINSGIEQVFAEHSHWDGFWPLAFKLCIVSFLI